MQNTYKILSLLLDYPNEDVKENLSGLKRVIEEENGLDKAQSNLLSQFLDPIQSITLSDWQMLYVQQFDFSSSTNLYLFDHVYGDSRERGQAMVDLTEMYNKAGFMPCSDELPDYLPLFLEYLSLLKNEETYDTFFNANEDFIFLKDENCKYLLYDDVGGKSPRL